MRKLNTKTITAIVANCLLYLVFLSGCSLFTKGEKEKYIIISSKLKEDYWSNPLSPCECRFFYKTYENMSDEEFLDSCHKYNIGDTIVGRKKN